jgi:hypothetical protein
MSELYMWTISQQGYFNSFKKLRNHPVHQISVSGWEGIWSHHERICVNTCDYFENPQFLSIQANCVCNKMIHHQSLKTFLKNWKLASRDNKLTPFLNGRGIRKTHRLFSVEIRYPKLHSWNISIDWRRFLPPWQLLATMSQTENR